MVKVCDECGNEFESESYDRSEGGKVCSQCRGRAEVLHYGLLEDLQRLEDEVGDDD